MLGINERNSSYSPANITLNRQRLNTFQPIGALQLYSPADIGAKFENVRVLSSDIT